MDDADRQGRGRIVDLPVSINEPYSTPMERPGGMPPRRPPPRPASRRAGWTLPPGVRIGAISFIIVAALSLFSESPGPVLASGATLALILALLWRGNEPPILLFPILYQWSSVATKPLLSAFKQVHVNELASYDGNLAKTSYFALAGVAALAVGIRLGVGSSRRNWEGMLNDEVRSLSLFQVLSVSVVLLVAGHTLTVLAWLIPPLTQLFLALSGLSWVGIFALAYWCLKNRRGYLYLLALMTFEIGIGLTGFFADFRGPILMLCLAALSARSKMKTADAIVVAAAAVLLITVGSFWSEVKVEYRKYASAGSGTQSVNVPFEDRLAYMGREISTFNGARFANGLDLLLSRHSYIDFLSSVTDHVPTVLPHEHGKRLGGAVLHIVTPRVLFPDKPPTEFDSEVTLKYTGLPIQIRQATSISIGYLGELYIDFAYFGSLVACLGGGFAFGLAFRMLRDRSRGPLLLRFGLCAVVAVSLATFDTALIKLVGSVGTVFVSAYLLQRFVLPHLVVLVKLRPVRPRPGPPMRPPAAPAYGVRK